MLHSVVSEANVWMGRERGVGWFWRNGREESALEVPLQWKSEKYFFFLLFFPFTLVSLEGKRIPLSPFPPNKNKHPSLPHFVNARYLHVKGSRCHMRFTIWFTNIILVTSNVIKVICDLSFYLLFSKKKSFYLLMNQLWMFTQLYLYSYLKSSFFFFCGWEGGGNWGMLGCFHCFACLETIFIWLCIGAVDDVPFHLP